MTVKKEGYPHRPVTVASAYVAAASVDTIDDADFESAEAADAYAHYADLETDDGATDMPHQTHWHACKHPCHTCTHQFRMIMIIPPPSEFHAYMFD